ncbi:MAG: Cytochrome c biogenesis protein CcsB [Syntrophorhabdus sp. PtaU1.Bin002]|nr:MAG: Cytochrome c biogenesis protein CcsB [Syntrophorhabdus sp. PtaU1.Bin002]
MSATKSKRPEVNPAKRGILASIQAFLTSVTFTIMLLSCIAIGSVLGTIVKQGADVEEYLSLYPEGTYRIIRLLGLDDVYHSLWFLALLILFAINLVACTLKRFFSVLKGRGRTELPDERALSAMTMSFRVEGSMSHETITGILPRGYTRVYRGEDGVVCEKGNPSRYGALMIHASIMLILAGGFIGLITGYKGSMVLGQGETKNLITISGGNPKERPLGFALKCKDFRISFYPGGAPKDYVSTIEVIDRGTTVLEKQIRVNDPLCYKGINVYQASYQKVPSFSFNIDGENVTLREKDTYNKDGFMMMVVRFETSVHDFGPGVMVAYLDQGEPKTTWFLRNVERLRQKTIRGITLRLDDIKEDLYTGLEISRDPGVWIVWAGFALMLLGLFVNFFMYHRRIYARKTSKGFIVAGVATRNKEAFGEEFERLKEKAYAIPS